MKKPSTLTLSVALWGMSSLAFVVSSQAQELTFETLFATGSPTAPSQLHWSPDGLHLSYVWTDDTGEALHVFDAATGKTRRLLALDDAEAGLDGLDDSAWAPIGATLLLQSEGDLYLLDSSSTSLDRLTETEATEEIPKFSPDGRSIAFVKKANLYVLSLPTADAPEPTVRALTEDGEEGTTLNGITDWVYWEEIWGRTSNGFWWSPDSSRIAYYRFDETEVPSYPMVDFTTPYPEVEWQKYPKAGETNAIVSVGVLELSTGETTWLETGEDPDIYLPRVDWLPNSKSVAVQRLSRDQDRLDLLSCRTTDGACNELHRETADTWVNVTSDLTFLEDGSFLWTSESSGWRRLALYDSTGKFVRYLSPEAWAVTALAAVDEASGEAVFSAYSTGTLGARHRSAFRSSIRSGEVKPITPSDSWNRVAVAPIDGNFVHWSGTSTHPTEIVVRDHEGQVLANLPTAARSGIDVAALPKPKFVTIPGPGSVKLPATLILPPDYDPEKSYPAIMYQYGCPASQVVADRWSWRGRSLWHSWMAERGYVVLMVDNQGSLFFGKHGEDMAHRRFGPGNLAAQEAGVDYLESMGSVDIERVGIWGGSGGGSNTLYTLLESPGTWRAGVAFAPVTDWTLYDTIWTERYLDHPEDNPDGYRDSSPLTYAENLEDSLLIVHGTADDNVHPQNTLVMSKALIAAGKPFEMSIHPRQKHGFRGDDLRHFYERMTEFFDRHLVASD